MAEGIPTQGGEAMHKRYLVKLDKDERKELSLLVKKENISAKKRTRAQVLLLADCGRHGPAWKDEAIAEACRVTVRTVENIRKRLVLEGLDSALNRKPQVRLSRQKILDGEKEAKVIALCCGAKPAGHARWTLRLLAERAVELEIVESVSHETVRQCLKKRPEAVAKEHVVHSSEAQRRVRVSQGKRALSLSKAL
jgi:Homeodomain-like domain